MSPSTEDASFLVLAVRELSKTYKRNGATVPPGVFDLVSVMTSGVTEGQAGSRVARAEAVQDVGSMKPLLVTYDDAAALLGVSLSTIKRRVSDGVLQPVSVGEGARRLRVADIESYVETLATTEDTAR